MNDYDDLVKRLRSRAYTGTVRDEAADAIEDLQSRVEFLEPYLIFYFTVAHGVKDFDPDGGLSQRSPLKS